MTHEKKPQPRKGYVLAEIPRRVGPLFEVEARFPTSGFVYSVGRSEVPFQAGDFIVWNEHGVTTPNELHDTFIIRVRDSAGTHILRADRDTEPVVREVVENFRRRGDDRWITLQDLNSERRETVRFLASEVIDYGIGSYTESGIRLDYVEHTPIHPIDTGLDHPPLVLIPVKEILFFIRRDDLVRRDDLRREAENA